MDSGGESAPVKQSKLASWIETLTNTFAGFGLSLLLQYLYFDVWLGFPLHVSQNFAFAVIMTFVSLARGFTMRRIFEALHIRRPLSPFMQAVVAERYRQIEQEGWSTSHDDDYARGQLARAGAAYLLGPERSTYTDYEADEVAVQLSGRTIFPWEQEWWKPKEYRRNLIRGCALAIAEGERFDRLKTKRVA
jgi:hypothetical protein